MHHLAVHAMQSTFRSAQPLRALTGVLGAPTDYAIQNKLTPFISMQDHHSLIYREEEREMLPTLKVISHRKSFAMDALTPHIVVRCRRDSVGTARAWLARTPVLRRDEAQRDRCVRPSSVSFLQSYLNLSSRCLIDGPPFRRNGRARRTSSLGTSLFVTVCVAD